MTRLVISLFDKILDEDFDDAKNFYAKLGITLNYDSSQAFLRQSVFEVEHASLISVIRYARANAILTRSHLSHRMLSRIMLFTCLSKGTR